MSTDSPKTASQPNSSPTLPDTCAQQFAGAAVIVTAGLWPYAHPTEAVATVSAEMGVRGQPRRRGGSDSAA